MTNSPSGTAEQTSRLGELVARRWLLTRFLPLVVVVVALLILVPALVDWKSANDARTAEPVGSATFAEILKPPFPEGVLVLTGQFDQVDHASQRAGSRLPFEFVDPVPAGVVAGDLVQVTCRVRWLKDGVLGPTNLRVDVCRDIVRLSSSSG